MVHLLLAVIYVSFISLGLPDSLLGAAWPVMYVDLGAPVSYVGMISMVIAVGTIVSSLQSDWLTRRFGTGLVTEVSVGMTAAALLGFSLSRSFLTLCLWAVPYGLGAGSVDASLNNYVALHYASRHMSWLHCMWGIGASAGPYIMGAALTGGQGWNTGYREIAFLQAVLTLILLLSLPMWKKKESGAGREDDEEREQQPLPLAEIVRIPGAREVMFTFFCYCAIEQTLNLWASSYLVLNVGLAPETAAGCASLFFIGITAGRAASGFLTMKLNDTNMVRMGEGILVLGIAVLLLPFGHGSAQAGLVLLGLGCAPVYPCIIHSTPEHFGADRSQAVIGVQMASAYVGTCLMPPVFGLIANHISVALFPVYLAVILTVMAWMHERLLKRVK